MKEKEEEKTEKINTGIFIIVFRGNTSRGKKKHPLRSAYDSTRWKELRYSDEIHWIGFDIMSNGNNNTLVLFDNIAAQDLLSKAKV